jgi:hypothetical protein
MRGRVKALDTKARRAMLEDGSALRSCTVLRRFWMQPRRLCEVKRSGTKHSRRERFGAAFPNRAARREQPS